jgi:hypothetical protein
MVKNKLMFTALLRESYLIIKRRQRQIGVFLSLVIFCGLQLWLASPTGASSGFWNQQIGSEEISDTFGANNGTPTDIKVMVVMFIKYLLGFLGIIMTVMIIWSGWRWMTAAGDEKKVETAKSHLLSAAIGGIIIVAAYVITSFAEELARKTITNSLF